MAVSTVKVTDYNEPVGKSGEVIKSKKMCIKLSRTSCTNSTRGDNCCSMNVEKVEVGVASRCKSALRKLWINGKEVYNSWGNYAELSTMKFTALTT